MRMLAAMPPLAAATCSAMAALALAITAKEPLVAASAIYRGRLLRIFIYD